MGGIQYSYLECLRYGNQLSSRLHDGLDFWHAAQTKRQTLIP